MQVRAFFILLLITISFCLGGCFGSVKGKVVSTSRIIVIPHRIKASPQSQVISVGQTVQIVVEEGVAPYQFKILRGDASIDATTGLLTVGSLAGSLILSVQDQRGDFFYANFEVVQRLELLPEITQAMTMSQIPFYVVGGRGPYEFKVESGEGNIDKTTGIFTAGLHNSTTLIKVTDQTGVSSTRTITVTSGFAFTQTSITQTQAAAVTLTLTGIPSSLQGQIQYELAGGRGKLEEVTGRSDQIKFTPYTLGGIAIVKAKAPYGVEAQAQIETTPTFKSALSFDYAQSFSVYSNQKTKLGLSGGKKPYTWSVLSGSGQFVGNEFQSTTQYGMSLIKVTDADNITRKLMVDVLSPYQEIQIAAQSKVVEVGSTTVISAFLGLGDSYNFSVVNGDITPVARLDGRVTQVEFRAPPSPGTSIVKVTDQSGRSQYAFLKIASALNIFPKQAHIKKGDGFQFIVSGGYEPYQYSLVAGSGTLDSDTGYYTSSTADDVVTVQVTDAQSRSIQGTIKVSSGLRAEPYGKSISLGSQQQIEVTGGVAPYTFRSVNGLGTVDANGLFQVPSFLPSYQNLKEIIEVKDAEGKIFLLEMYIRGTLNVTQQLVEPYNASNFPSAVINLKETFYLSVKDKINFVVTGGAPPYYISVNDPTKMSTSQSQGDQFELRALATGSVIVTVEDSLHVRKILKYYQILPEFKIKQNVFHLIAKQESTFVVEGGFTKDTVTSLLDKQVVLTKNLGKTGAVSNIDETGFKYLAPDLKSNLLKQTNNLEFKDGLGHYIQIKLTLNPDFGIFDLMEKDQTVATDTNSQLTVGKTVVGGAIYAGYFDEEYKRYMVMPAACDYEQLNGHSTSHVNEDFTPSCSENSDALDFVQKTWNDGNNNYYDIPNVISLASDANSILGVDTKVSSLMCVDITDPDIKKVTCQSGEEATQEIVKVTSSFSPPLSTVDQERLKNLGGYHAAALYCANLNVGGFDDWFLPSKTELAYIYCLSKKYGDSTNSNVYPQESYNHNGMAACSDYVGAYGDLGISGFRKKHIDQWGFEVPAYYWSSTEIKTQWPDWATSAYIQNFNNGQQFGDKVDLATDPDTVKDTPYFIRCVRRY
jgi:hypothetical protein